jgi:hypothetical protein
VAFPTMGEEASGAIYCFMQPAERDLERRIGEHKNRMQALEECERDENSRAYDMEITNNKSCLAMLEPWASEKCVLGPVWRSAGIRAREVIKNYHFKLDWALIKLITRTGSPNKANSAIK